MNKELNDKQKVTGTNVPLVYDKTKEYHERLIYGEKLANERKLEREKIARESEKDNLHYLIKLEKERTKLQNTKQLEKDNNNVRNYISSLPEYTKKFYSNKHEKDDVSQIETKFLVGSIFTNSEYAVIKENLCFAYQITEIKDDMILAVSLKLDTITIPSSKRISDMTQCGSKKLHQPIEIISEPVIFEKSNFGKKRCIKNNFLCLLEHDYKNELNIPTWTTVNDNWDL